MPIQKNKVGRPTKYSKAILEASKKYIASYDSLGDAIPSIAGLASLLGIRRETLHAWARDEKKAEFSHILEQLRATQEKVLINKGLAGDFNATIVKLVLGKHGYTDRQDRQITGEGGGPLKVLKVDFKDLSPKEAEQVYREFASGD